jgi:hypothetical protein
LPSSPRWTQIVLLWTLRWGGTKGGEC